METEKKLQVKKEWKTPELIILVRSKPEEAVLGMCKSSGRTIETAAEYSACQFTIITKCTGCLESPGS